MKLLVVTIAKVDRPSQWLTLTTIFISHNMKHLTIQKIIKPGVCLIYSPVVTPLIWIYPWLEA